MPELKKRKAASALLETATSAKAQTSIYSFTRISKVQAAPPKSLKSTIVTSQVDILPPTSTKRKLSATSESELDHELTPDSKRPRSDKGSDLGSVSHSPRADHDAIISYFRAGNLTASPRPRSAKCSQSPTQATCHSTREATTSSSREADKARGPISLPDELQDIIDLDSAFLTALSLHFAHNGTNQPADLNSLVIDITRVWGKRNVVRLDIIRTLGVQNYKGGSNLHSKFAASQLSLSDYGAGKICIEIGDSPISRSKLGIPIDEALLHTSFIQNLTHLWSEYVSVLEGQGGDANKFIEDLPKAPIVLCSSLLKISPLLSKGKQRLAEFKTASKVFQKESSKRQGRLEPEIGSDSVKSRSKGLEERIRARRLLQTKIPQALSQAQRDRHLALQRLEEVVSVLDILISSSRRAPLHISESGAEGGEKCHLLRLSFTMPTILGHLRDSMRNPISKEEGRRCIRILGKEVASQWVVLVQLGQLETVVLDSERRPGTEDIHSRIKLLLGEHQ